MKVEHQRSTPLAVTPIAKPRAQWPVFLALFLMVAGVCSGMYVALKAGQHRSDHHFGSLVFDGIDGGLKTALPKGIHQTIQQVMLVYLKPADQIKKAKAVIAGSKDGGKELSVLQQKADSFLNSWLAIAAVVCTGFGLFLRIVLNVFVWH